MAQLEMMCGCALVTDFFVTTKAKAASAAARSLATDGKRMLRPDRRVVHAVVGSSTTTNFRGGG